MTTVAPIRLTVQSDWTPLVLLVRQIDLAVRLTHRQFQIEGLHHTSPVKRNSYSGSTTNRKIQSRRTVGRVSESIRM